METPCDLMPKQEKAIIFLLSKPTIGAAAKAAGVGESTLYGWLKDPTFKTAYHAARRSLLDASLATINSGVVDAVKTLKRNLRCGIPAAEVRAAVAILDKAINAQAMADLQIEVAELRARLERDDADARQHDGGNTEVTGAGVTTGSSHSPDPEPAQGRPTAGDDGHGSDARPVASGPDPQPGPAGSGPLHPPVREDADGGGPSDGPLLDPA